MPYHYVDCVKLAIDTARARIPLLQDSAVNEFADIVSQDVMRGDWTAIEGQPLHKSGKSLESYLDYLIMERTDKGVCHWLIPEIVVEATEMWLNPTLTAQGKRWKEINAVLNDPAATNEAMAKEAAKFGCTVGSTMPGVKPGTKPTAPDAKSNRDNPYGPCAPGREQERLDRIIKFLKTAKPSQVNSMALSAGCAIDGKPLARRG
jgi:hypothetical protein